jgi:hypothetical protein
MEDKMMHPNATGPETPCPVCGLPLGKSGCSDILHEGAALTCGVVGRLVPKNVRVKNPYFWHCRVLGQHNQYFGSSEEADVDHAKKHAEHGK